jgi:hydroxymethylpyrimidine pyrophosphatase-like HAD family hydrolase
LETLLLRVREGAKGAATGTATTRIVSIGDGENDASMLRGATVGVALGNACAETKRAAEHVLEETNDDDGVAVAIRKFVL